MWSLLDFIAKIKNDFIYLTLLLFCVLVGPYYRRISEKQQKKWVGSFIGLLLIIIVSGFNAIHPILTVLFGIIVIKTATVRYCHIITFFLLFGYLFFFRLADKLGLPLPTGQSNLIEMIIVLRVVGVAFEINGSWLAFASAKKVETENRDSTVHEEKDPEFTEIVNPSLLDLFHYSFCYIGLLTGPYYRYRTFNDYFTRPFYKHVDCLGFTIKNLKSVPFYIALYLVFSNTWPLDYILTEEHNNRHFFYRMIYPWFLFAAFRQRIYAGMTMAESMCTSAGFGAYPVEGRNRTGHGPTVGYAKLRAMIHAALFVSVIWHGFHAGYFFCIYFCPFYLMAEDIYYKLYYKEATGLKKKVIGFIMWLLRSHSESYQAAAFLLLTFDRIWIYYSSVYHYWYGVWFAFLIFGLALKQMSRRNKPKLQNPLNSKSEDVVMK